MANNNQPNVQAQGLDALTENVINVIKVSNIIGQTLGPKGADVLVVNNIGDSITSNDGATILTNLNITNPIIQSLVESANILADRVGDGTTSMTVIAGKLCQYGLELKQEEGVDTVTITKGYKIALQKTDELLERYSKEIDTNDKVALKNFVKTTLTGKNSEGLESIYNICVDAVIKTDGDLNQIRKLKPKTGSVSNTELVEGLVLDVNSPLNKMPEDIKKAKVILLDDALELVNPALDMKIDISGVNQYNNLIEMEKDTVIAKAKKIKELGANVVICQRNIHDYALDYFARNNILAVRNVPKEDLEILSKGKGTIVKNIDTARKDDILIVERAYIKEYADERYIVIEGNTKAVTIVIGGSNKLNQDEYERGINDALGVIKTIRKYKQYVLGGGVIEVKLAYDLREYAKTIENGNYQAIIEKYASALEYIPKLLAQSAGMQKLTALGKMRYNKDKDYGINVEDAEVTNLTDVLEPLELKRSIYTTATEYANNVLRIKYILQGRTE